MASMVNVLVLSSLYISSACALYCFQCDSSQSGCGEKVDILLQKWRECPNDGAIPMCVKITKQAGTTMHITRACLSTLKQSTEYREDLPTVRRHNYCNPGRLTPDAQKYSDGSGRVRDENDKRIYCFCNDWNGCNPASRFSARPLAALVVVLVSALTARWLS